MLRANGRRIAEKKRQGKLFLSSRTTLRGEWRDAIAWFTTDAEEDRALGEGRGMPSKTPKYEQRKI